MPTGGNCGLEGSGGVRFDDAVPGKRSAAATKHGGSLDESRKPRKDEAGVSVEHEHQSNGCR